jgi:branched-chain amino acid transport system substrate-binding protein
LVIGIAAAMAAVVFLVCGGVVASHALSSDNSDGDTYYDAATASPTAEPSPTGPPCPQRLAYLGAVTGAGRDLGKRVQNGAQLAVQQYNAAHSGCDVVLKTYDTGSNAAKAGKLSATIAADTTTVGVIGPVSPDEVSAAGGAEDKVGLPLISPVGDAVGLSNWQAYHQVIGDENSPALFTRNYFVNVLKSQRIFLVDDGSKPATALSGIIRNDLGELAVGDETVKSDAASTQSLADRIRTSDATVVFYAGAPASGGRLRKALTDDGGRNVTMVGTPQLDAPVFFAQAGAAAEGTTLLGPYLPPADAPAAFVTAYKQAYKAAPPRYAAEAYDAAKVFIDGIAAGKTDRKQMTDFLTTYSAQGLTKQIKFNDLGDIDTPVMWLYQATDGAFVSKGKLATS